MDITIAHDITIVGLQSILVVQVDSPPHILKIRIARGFESLYIAEILSHRDNKGVTVQKITCPKVVNVDFMDALIIIINLYLRSYKPTPIRPKLFLVKS